VPGEEITYIYDGENRLKEVSISTGKAVEYSYEGDELAGIWLRSGVFSAKGVFEEGRMIESTDFFGAKTEYEYTPDGRISRVTDAQGWQAAYEYDERGQLQEVHLPDGSRIEYEYASTEPGQLAQVNIYPGDGSGER
jgi:YD repeat-containing protein